MNLRFNLKRILLVSTLIILFLLLSAIAVCATDESLAAPTNLHWYENSKYKFAFESVDNAYGYVVIYDIDNSQHREHLIDSDRYSMIFKNTDAPGFIEVPMDVFDFSFNNMTISVAALTQSQFENEDYSNVNYVSISTSYTRPLQSLPMVTDIEWSTSDSAIVSWGAVQNALKYFVQVYKYIDSDQGYYWKNYGAMTLSDTQLNITEAYGSDYQNIAVRITAISNDMDSIANSLPSEYSFRTGEQTRLWMRGIYHDGNQFVLHETAVKTLHYAPKDETPCLAFCYGTSTSPEAIDVSTIKYMYFKSFEGSNNMITWSDFQMIGTYRYLTFSFHELGFGILFVNYNGLEYQFEINSELPLVGLYSANTVSVENYTNTVDSASGQDYWIISQGISISAIQTDPNPLYGIDDVTYSTESAMSIRVHFNRVVQQDETYGFLATLSDGQRKSKYITVYNGTESLMYSGWCGDNVEYVFNTTTGALNISGSGVMYDYDWNEIPWYAFKEEIRTVVFSGTVTHLSEHAFIGCNNITSISLPESLTSIGVNALRNMDSITEIMIPKNVVSIDGSGQTFAFCSSLQRINVAEGNQYWKSVDGVLYTADGRDLRAYPAGKTGSVYNIPATTTSIAGMCFSGNDYIKVINIPNSVKEFHGSYVVFDCDEIEQINYLGTQSQWDAIVKYQGDDEYIFSNCATVTFKNVNAIASVVGNNRIRQGTSFAVLVTLDGPISFNDLSLEIGYDSDVLTLDSIDVPFASGKCTVSQSIEAHPYVIMWNSLDPVAFNPSSDGNLVLLHFTVCDSAVITESSITVDYYKGRYGDYTDGVEVNYYGNNADASALGLKYKNCSINIIDYTPGDINDDTYVDDLDVINLLQYVAGWENLNLKLSSLDTDGDGKNISSLDALYLMKYLAEWQVELY